MSKVLPVALALLAAGSATLTAQQVPTVALGATTAVYEEPFTRIEGVRELPGGRIIVADSRDKTLQLIDLASGSATRIGREGSGPGEYQFLRGLVAMPNNETWLNDPMQSRFLRIDATGKVVETVSYPTGMGPGTTVAGADAQGRIYWEGSAIGSPGSGGSLQFQSGDDGAIQSRDSVPVIRWDRRTNRLDTLIQVKGPTMKINVSGGDNSRTVMVRSTPYTARDAWGVAPDGRVSVARSGQYRVDTRAAAGTRVTGPAVGATPFRVTDRDKQDFMRNMRNAPRMVRSFGSGGATAPTPPEPRVEDFEWPEHKPYFDAATVRMSPAGEFWVMRYRAAGDEIPVYDVFDANGRLARRVSLPAKTRLVGFGEGTVYTVRTDEDDLQYLQRHRVP
jgi:hypothetical protein